MSVEPTVTIPAADYRRLLELVELDDRLITCEVCGAWIDRDDPAYCSAEDFTGCWKVAARSGSEDLCRSYRSTVLEAPPGSIRALPLRPEAATETTEGGDNAAR